MGPSHLRGRPTGRLVPLIGVDSRRKKVAEFRRVFHQATQELAEEFGTPHPNPLPIRWGEGGSGRMPLRLSPSPHRVGMGLGGGVATPKRVTALFPQAKVDMATAADFAGP